VRWSSPTAFRSRERKVLIAFAIALAIGEFVGALYLDWPAGIVFIAAAIWIRRGGIGGVILLAVLALVDLVAVALWPPPESGFHAREDAVDWIVQMVFVVVAVLGLFAATAVLVERLRSRRTPPTT